MNPQLVGWLDLGDRLHSALALADEGVASPQNPPGVKLLQGGCGGLYSSCLLG